jgi:hypothetical protein
MKNSLPDAVKACLWSYDTDQIDLSVPAHKQRVIENVLNRGTYPAVDWLLSTFSKREIAEAITYSQASVWNKKSLSLWSMVFAAHPERMTRFA